MPFMMYGHATTATEASTGKPVCVICVGLSPLALVVAQDPDLKDRKARCYCGNTTPSSTSLFAFEYLGPGSPNSVRSCKCGYFDTAHKPEMKLKCRKFVPVGPLEFDRYYCGCRGWD